MVRFASRGKNLQEKYKQLNTLQSLSTTLRANSIPFLGGKRADWLFEGFRARIPEVSAIEYELVNQINQSAA